MLLKWLAVQAGSSLPGNLKNVKALMDHPAFHITTPNCCYSLFLGFARSVNFHAADGSGYEFIGDAVIKVRLGDILAVHKHLVLHWLSLCSSSSQDYSGQELGVYGVDICTETVLMQ